MTERRILLGVGVLFFMLVVCNCLCTTAVTISKITKKPAGNKNVGATEIEGFLETDYVKPVGVTKPTKPAAATKPTKPALQLSDGGMNSGTIFQSDPTQNKVNPVIPIRNRGNNINEPPYNDQIGESPAMNSVLLPGEKTRECRDPHRKRTKYPLDHPHACQYTGLTTKIFNNADGVPYVNPHGKIYKCPKGSRRTFEPVDSPKACADGIFGTFSKAQFVDNQFAASTMEEFSFTV